MRKIRAAVLGVALTFGAAVAAANAQSGGSSEPDVSASPSLTKDRLSADDLRELVKLPLSDFMSGDESKGQTDFEALLDDQVRAKGPTSVEAADLLSAMGVSLYQAASDAGNEPLERKSLDYLRRAIGAHRAAFGPDHPEIALALNDFAQAELNLFPTDPTGDAEAALSDAYRIRMVALGPMDPETLDTMAALAQVQGLPSHTAGDSGKIASARALFEKAIKGEEPTAGQYPYRIGTLYLNYAKFCAANHDLESAQKYFSMAENQYDTIDGAGDTLSDTEAFGALDFSLTLKGSGYPDEAAAVRERFATKIAAMMSRAKKAP